MLRGSCPAVSYTLQTFRLKEFKRLQAALTPEETSTLIEAGKMYLAAGKRVGIDYAEEAADFPWRFYTDET